VTLSPALRRLLLLLYLAGVLLFVDQLAELVSALLSAPMAPASPAWRFGAFGLLVSRTSGFLIADAMLFLPAVALEHRRTLRGLATLHLLLAFGLLAGAGTFVLDWLQVRKGVRPGGATALDVAALRAGLVGLVTAGLAAWAGVAVLRVTGLMRRSQSRVTEASLIHTVRREELP
jgi:hypothetical protein